MQPPRLSVVERDDEEPVLEKAEPLHDGDDRGHDDSRRGERKRPLSPASVAALQARIAEELAGLAAGVADGAIVGGELVYDAADMAVAAVAPTVEPPLDDPAAGKARAEAVRVMEAILFAATEPVDQARLAAHLPEGCAFADVMAELERHYSGRGIALVRVAGKWAFRTAGDLGWLLERHATEERRLSKAAQETLAIISYHQPVTRAEIEEIRGVATSKGTLDVLLETGWVRPRGRRRAPGKPITYGTTDAFLGHFGLDAIKDLPGLAELKGAGLLDANLPPGFTIPDPSDAAALLPDELPLEDEVVQDELALDESSDEDAAEGSESEIGDDGEDGASR